MDWKWSTFSNCTPKQICFYTILDTQSLGVVFQLFQTRHPMVISTIGATLLRNSFRKALTLKYAIFYSMAKNQIKNNLMLLILKLRIKCTFIRRFLIFIKAFNTMLIRWVLCAVLSELYLAFWILKKTLRTQNIENNVPLNLSQKCLF
jgi:hypothetical protein